jgi:hypothetical protein
MPPLDRNAAGASESAEGSDLAETQRRIGELLKRQSIVRVNGRARTIEGLSAVQVAQASRSFI